MEMWIPTLAPTRSPPLILQHLPYPSTPVAHKRRQLLHQRLSLLRRLVHRCRPRTRVCARSETGPQAPAGSDTRDADRHVIVVIVMRLQALRCRDA